MNWRTEKPQGNIILAKLVPEWQPRYDVLYYDMKSRRYYDYCGETTPDSAIEKWVEITEED